MLSNYLSGNLKFVIAIFVSVTIVDHEIGLARSRLFCAPLFNSFKDIDSARQAYLQVASQVIELQRHNKALNRDLDPLTIHKLAQSLMDHLEEFMFLSNIEYWRVDESQFGCGKIIFKKTAASPLNKLASRLSRRMGGLTLEFNPCLLLSAKSGAAYLPLTHHLVISLKTPLKGNLREVSLLHELRHAKNYRAAEEGQVLPLHGWMGSIDGTIPAMDSHLYYAKEVSFDELQTFLSSMRLIFLEIKKAHALQDKEKVESWRAHFHEHVSTGLEISHALMATIPAALQKIHSQRVYFFTNDSEVISGFMRIRVENGALLEIILPLVKSGAEDDAKNLFYFREQLRLVLSTAEKYWDRFLSIRAQFKAELDSAHFIEKLESKLDLLRPIR